MGSFTPLVSSTFGGMKGAATTAYKRFGSLLASKRDQSYSSVMSGMRRSTTISLLRSAVTYLHEARSHCGGPLDLALCEGQVLPSHELLSVYSLQF